jgi:hypothetical protein
MHLGTIVNMACFWKEIGLGSIQFVWSSGLLLVPQSCTHGMK